MKFPQVPHLLISGNEEGSATELKNLSPPCLAIFSILKQVHANMASLLQICKVAVELRHFKPQVHCVRVQN